MPPTLQLFSRCQHIRSTAPEHVATDACKCQFIVPWKFSTKKSSTEMSNHNPFQFCHQPFPWPYCQRQNYRLLISNSTGSLIRVIIMAKQFLTVIQVVPFQRKGYNEGKQAFLSKLHNPICLLQWGVWEDLIKIYTSFQKTLWPETPQWTFTNYWLHVNFSSPFEMCTEWLNFGIFFFLLFV